MTHFDDDVHDFTFDDDGFPIQEVPTITPVPDVPDSAFCDEKNITDLFNMSGAVYDVTLSLAEGTLSWTSGNALPNAIKKKSKGLSFFRSNSSNKLPTDVKSHVCLRDLYGVRVHRRRRADQKPGEGTCLGFGVFLSEKKEHSNILKPRVIYFEHLSEELCTRWVTKIRSYLNAIPGRPKSVKLFLQSHAGGKCGRYIYMHKIHPIFQNAEIDVDITEIQHNEHIKQEMIHLNLDDFDWIVSVGGDGTANKVADALLKRAQKEYDVELKPGLNPVKAPLPLGIIPQGNTNHIVHSTTGCDDPITATLHIIYGHSVSVDVCSVCTEHKFLQWAFNSQYGFPASVLSFMDRYKALGSTKLDVAFIKALTKAKLRSYDCVVEYIPAPSIISPVFNTPCLTGCNICWTENLNDSSLITSDLVEEFDPLAVSGSSSSIIDLTNENPWKNSKGSFMSVGVFSIPGLNHLAPRGLSPTTHLSDGHLDLVLVHNTDRKDFVRYLRRHGNSKNQFDFPFVEVQRVKEVRFRPRVPISWNYKDHDYSEIDYEMAKLRRRQSQQTKSVDVLDLEDVSSCSSSSQSVGERADSTLALNGLSASDDDNDHDGNDNDDVDNDNCNNRIKSADSKSKSPAVPAFPPNKLVGPQYRPTFTDQEIARRKKHQRKKEERAKAKEEARMFSSWSIDNELSKERELSFKIFHGLLQICGQGVSPEAEPKDVNFNCLPFVK
ncbi:ceramide kinase-like protein [Gigantopelta aegis]|uniref:ceramide kinase-like protein n=1 Tax=Gigantopelta aegis TaxID=1735272 RepID=UPI001B88CA43|nr:ceramide kinase-like protein [Gigantopelta aegis]